MSSRTKINTNFVFLPRNFYDWGNVFANPIRLCQPKFSPSIDNVDRGVGFNQKCQITKKTRMCVYVKVIQKFRKDRKSSSCQIVCDCVSQNAIR